MWNIAIPSWQDLRKDIQGELNVGHWVGLVIGAMILVLIVAAIWSQFTAALASYAENETTFGSVLASVVPILVGAGILLAFVYVFIQQIKTD